MRPQLSIRLHPSDHDRVVALAKGQGRTITETVRRLVRAAFAEAFGDADPAGARRDAGGTP